MFATVIILLLAAIGVGLIIGSFFLPKTIRVRNSLRYRYRSSDPTHVDQKFPHWPFLVGGIGFCLLALMSFGLASYTQVGASDEFVVTSFGHIDGVIGPGIHWTKPWQDTTPWDHSVQQLSFEGNPGKNGGGCLQIRIALQQPACADVIVFVKDEPGAAAQQFRNYRTFQRLMSAYFARGIIARYYNNVFEKFDPVHITSLSAQGKTGGATVTSLTTQVLASLRTAYNGTFDVTSLNTGPVHYSGAVENGLSRVVVAKANEEASVINKATAANVAAANKTLQSNGQLSPTVVEQNCLTITQTQAQDGYRWQPGWSCTPGGSSTGVLVNTIPGH